ncbi:hypothetical protein, partial [Mycobacterium sp.]|uniref:hypothetical protein n=1 Tax=Mycobacterium sp. TaxID=1785 RepID=UPI003BAEB59E
SVRQWATGVGLAGGIAVAAAIIATAGAPVIRADTVDDLIGSADWNVTGASTIALFDPNIGTDGAASSSAVTDPAGLLSEAATNLTGANQLLNDIPSGEFAPVATQMMLQDTVLQDLGFLESAESSLSSLDNGALSDLLNPWFTSVDQGWEQASEAMLNVDQALETAVATGSATDESTALLGLLTPDLEILGPGVNSFLIIFADLVTGADPISAADFASILDPAAVLDPSMFTDLVSSIGF